MASNTEHLNLLKKDPVADGNETFNIETMLNENWDKIDAAVGQVREELQDIDIPLSDATDGTRSNVAASEKAVGQVMSAATSAQDTANAANTAAAAAQARADSAFQLGVERKNEVVAALNSMGVSASTSESWDSLIGKMAAIINRGGQVITPGTTNKAIPAGYHNGSGYVVGEPNLIAGNLPKDKTFWGIVGALERMTTAEKQAIANAITGKGVVASASDTNAILAQKIGQITTQLKQASGNASGSHSLEVNNLDFNPMVIMFGYSGNFRYSVNSWDDRTASVSGDAYFFREGDLSYKRLISETNSGRDGSTNLEVTATNKWLPNGFIINVSLWTNYSITYSSRGIGRWYAFGI